MSPHLLLRRAAGHGNAQAPEQGAIEESPRHGFCHKHARSSLLGRVRNGSLRASLCRSRLSNLSCRARRLSAHGQRTCTLPGSVSSFFRLAYATQRSLPLRLRELLACGAAALSTHLRPRGAGTVWSHSQTGAACSSVAWTETGRAIRACGCFPAVSRGLTKPRQCSCTDSPRRTGPAAMHWERKEARCADGLKLEPRTGSTASAVGRKLYLYGGLQPLTGLCFGDVLVLDTGERMNRSSCGPRGARGPPPPA